MKINIVTIFPEFFRVPLATSIPGRAREKGLVEYRVVDLRNFTHDRHRTVDDTLYGGGAGMVMKPEPFFEAVESLGGAGGGSPGEGRREGDEGAAVQPPPALYARPVGPIILLSPRGRVFRHEDAVRLSLEPEITLLAGHYKDVDQRVAEHLATEELSLGDFVLSGGEIPALAVTDAVVRLLPGAMGDHESAATDSFYEEGLLSAPSYTRPADFRGLEVPDVLLSGDHRKVEAWRRRESERLTRERRPDLAKALQEEDREDPDADRE
jgi:tRNA (guanine37-N1)-methyltransferase